MPLNSTHEFAEAKELLEGASRVVIMSHRHPDGDTIGSNLALRLFLKSRDVEVVSACVDALPEMFGFLPDSQTFVTDFSYDKNTIFVAVDAGAHYMTRYHELKPEVYSGRYPLINIDHHVSNERYGTVNLVDPQAAAAVQVLYRLFRFAGWPITRHIATCLLSGLYFDTGSFMHSNTSPEVLQMAATLLRKGADFRMIVKQQFRTNPVARLKLWGRALSRLSMNGNRVAASTITNRDFNECDASHDDLTGVIDYLNSVPESKFSLLVSEDGKGNVKGSLRTRDSIDLSKVASVFGGGGHKKASGFSFPGTLQIYKDRVRII